MPHMTQAQLAEIGQQLINDNRAECRRMGTILFQIAAKEASEYVEGKITSPAGSRVVSCNGVAYCLDNLNWENLHLEKIEAIKELRSYFGLSLKSAKEIVEKYEEAFMWSNNYQANYWDDMP